MANNTVRQNLYNSISFGFASVSVITSLHLFFLVETFIEDRVQKPALFKQASCGIVCVFSIDWHEKDQDSSRSPNHGRLLSQDVVLALFS